MKSNMKEYDRFVAISRMGEKYWGVDFDKLKEKVDVFNSKVGPKWYIMRYTEDMYRGLVGRNMDYKLCPGIVVYDPFKVSDRDLDMYYYVNKYKKSFGKKNVL